ncbi:MAG: hypothetical protein HFJ55_06110 [Clostridia bacterium]|nr:hypothetical protein [Clostridia bacterium]
MLTGENGIISQAQNAKEATAISQAREKLELVFENAKIKKHTDLQYNEEEYLDNMMKEEITNIEIKGDIVIVDGFVFEIDRSVPKIGQYLGKEKDTVFPQIGTTVTLAEDKKTATINITAKEEKNGISKIEIIQYGQVIETYECGNSKEQITKDFIAKQNGIYTIKVYAGIALSEKVKVAGIIANIEYSPNGDEIYKKQHQVKIVAKGTEDNIKNIKYQWLNTTVEPEANSFTITCNNGETLIKNEVTGIYYLWTLIETESGENYITRSEPFYFDNKMPTATLTSAPVSENEFKLTAKASDVESGIERYEFYVGGVLKETVTTNEQTATYNFARGSMGEEECYIKVFDIAGNMEQISTSARTKMYTWEMWSVDFDVSYSESGWETCPDVTLSTISNNPHIICKDEPHLRSDTGKGWEYGGGPAYSGGTLSAKISATEGWGSRREILCIRFR